MSQRWDQSMRREWRSIFVLLHSGTVSRVRGSKRWARRQRQARRWSLHPWAARTETGSGVFSFGREMPRDQAARYCSLPAAFFFDSGD